MSNSRRRMIREVMEVIVEDCPPVAASTQPGVYDDVVGLVSSQIDAMPSHLRHPYYAALLAFYYLPVLRYGRSFRHLPPSRKTSYLRFWGNGRLGFARDFVRLMRSCILLAYLDHELVRRRFTKPEAVSGPSDSDRARPDGASTER